MALGIEDVFLYGSVKSAKSILGGRVALTLCRAVHGCSLDSLLCMLSSAIAQPSVSSIQLRWVSGCSWAVFSVFWGDDVMTLR